MSTLRITATFFRGFQHNKEDARRKVLENGLKHIELNGTATQIHPSTKRRTCPY